MKKVIHAVALTAGFLALTVVPFDSFAAGWISDQTGFRYEKEDGTFVKSGFQKSDACSYYLDENSYMVTGWHSIEGSYYYLEPSGTMNGTMWLPKGAMWTDSWTPDGYYVDAFGKWIEGAGHKENTTGSQTSQAVSPSSDTSITTVNGWVQEEQRWKYKTAKGYVTNAWKKVNSKRYYFDSESFMLTGFQEIDGEKYYFKDSGELVSKTFELDGTYYVVEDGAIIEEVDELDWSDYKKENHIKSVDKSINKKSNTTGEKKDDGLEKEDSDNGRGPASD